MSKGKDTFYAKYGKRGLDILLSAAGMTVLAPVYLGTGLLVAKNLGRPVLYRQRRPGKDGKVFQLYKFRSMLDAVDAEGNPLPDSDRLTDFGKKLRSTSLDELPELFNILKGDMSVVGPRPLLEEYLPLYSEEQRRRHDVRPGLTGLAQINGRNAISWTEKFRFDVDYVDNLSFGLDLRIFFGTVKAVLKREGISSETSDTMEEFDGTN